MKTLHGISIGSIWERLLGVGKRRRLDAIMMLATKRGTTGGLFKRIDENRELLQLLQDECPTFLREHSWIEGWIRGNDNFFTELRAILDVAAALEGVVPV